MSFFTYRQNNSGGAHQFDASAGITKYVIVEADDWQHADYLAQRIGLYFNGSGDCNCCGSRWESAQWGERCADRPEIDGDSVAALMEGDHFYKWMKPQDPEVFVHFRNRPGALGLVYGTPGRYGLFDESTC